MIDKYKELENQYNVYARQNPSMDNDQQFEDITGQLA